MDLSEARSVIERSYSGWNHGDLETLEALYDPDCEWDATRLPVDSIVYRGHAGLRRAVADWRSNWEWFRLEPAEVRRLADDLLWVVGRGEGVGKGSGVPVTLPAVYQVITLRGGRILRVENHLDVERAQAAADEARRRSETYAKPE